MSWPARIERVRRSCVRFPLQVSNIMGSSTVDALEAIQIAVFAVPGVLSFVGVTRGCSSPRAELRWRHRLHTTWTPDASGRLHQVLPFVLWSPFLCMHALAAHTGGPKIVAMDSPCQHRVAISTTPTRSLITCSLLYTFV